MNVCDLNDYYFQTLKPRVDRIRSMQQKRFYSGKGWENVGPEKLPGNRASTLAQLWYQKSYLQILHAEGHWMAPFIEQEIGRLKRQLQVLQ